MNYIENKLEDLGFSIEKKDVFIKKEWRPVEWSLGYEFKNKIHSIASAFPTTILKGLSISISKLSP